MAQDNSDNPQPRGLSSFANLLGSNAGTISSAPVIYSQQSGADDQQQDAAQSKKQQINSALRFQPTKRPQIQSQKKTKPAFPKTQPQAQSSSSPDAAQQANKPSAAPNIVALAANPPSKASLADFLGDDNDDGFYAATQPRERGGRKKKKKKKNHNQEQEQNWDDIYDPSRPNDYNQYKGSEEQMHEIADWKDHLYRHRTLRDRSIEAPESDQDEYPRIKSQFAPPKSYNFAPPSDLNTPTPPAPPAPAPPAPADIPDDPTGEDAYARRLRLSGLGAAPPPPPPETAQPPAPPSALPAGSISRAPVRYDVPAPAPDQPSEAQLAAELAEEAASAQDAEDGPRSKTPGQKGFAQRIMEKYGWQKGKGLGANETGIITPLAMKAEKRKKLPDSKGGKWATPSGMGKITGGKKAKGSDEEGKHGKMGPVVVMGNMLVGLDVQQELDEGSIMQEIGEELDKAGGRVERIYIDRYTMAGDVPVFAKFTNELSALRAVNAMDGRVFNGNTIRARYFDSDKFEKGDYSVEWPEDQGEASGEAMNDG